jgi:ribosomal protein L7/L12
VNYSQERAYRIHLILMALSGDKINKVDAIKAIREVANFSLPDSKYIVDNWEEMFREFVRKIDREFI